MHLPFGISIVVAAAFAGTALTTLRAEVNKPQEISAGVWFHEGDIGRKGHCNNGWILFKDYILVIDGNFPSGAKEIIPKIRASSDRPIRFTFDTHHHGDHAYGNQVWADLGATIIAHEGALAEMKKYETGYYGDKPGRWEEAARGREDVKESRLHPPTLVFPKTMVFDDGERRVEFHWFGVAHTHGDGFAWLPKERILFTGDACVNGPYNYMGDGNALEWIKTLEAARGLGPKTICPGHGLTGGVEVLDRQIAYLKALVAEVGKLRAAGRTPVEAKAAVDTIRSVLQTNADHALYVGGMFASQVEKIWVDLGGKPFETAAAIPRRTAEPRIPSSDRDVLAKTR